ncbi:MAG TPA: hypothetical protein VNW54_04130 [Granulicella sp.]|jgi:hypothetical protein|nr:hypothetical protein [Granulicella sp.]
MTITKITTTTTTANPFAFYEKGPAYRRAFPFPPKADAPPGNNMRCVASSHLQVHGGRRNEDVSSNPDSSTRTLPDCVDPLSSPSTIPPPRGYDQGYPQGSAGWDTPPQEFRDIQRQGVHDGIEGARRDFDNHRHPDVKNRDEYRHPHVPRSARNDYSEGFERGYEAAIAHLYDRDRDHDHDYNPH